jgi:AcrR family transcriptional regulator
MRGLAEHLRLATSAIYYHFPNKESLAVAYLDLEMDRLIESATSVASARMPVVERLRAFLDVHIGFQLDWLELLSGDPTSVRGFNALVEEVPKDARSKISAKQRNYFELLRRLVREGMAAGELVADDPTVTAFALLSPGEHLIQWYRPTGRLSRKQVTERLVTMVMRMVSRPLSATFTA